jgi:hypothetical protein
VNAPSATCTHHTPREAVGVCVRCGDALCRDGITKIDGVNHCKDCLESMAAAHAPQAPAQPLPVSDFVALGFGLSLLSMLAWVMLEVLMPGAGTP